MLLIFCSAAVSFGDRQQCTIVAQVSTGGDRSVSAGPKTATRSRFDELVGMVRLGEAPGRELAMSVLGATEWPDTQADRAVKLMCEVLESSDRIDREIAAESIRHFAKVHPAHAMKAVVPLTRAMQQTADKGELVEIAGALGEIGPAASDSTPSLRYASK